MAVTSTEGKHVCCSCLQWVGTQYDGEKRPYRVILTADGERIFCADTEACERRWQGQKDADRFAAAEARAYFPEPDDDDEVV